MIYLAVGNSVQVKVTPKPLGVTTFIQQAQWSSHDPAVASVEANAGDPTGCMATITAAKGARTDAAADIIWRYKNNNGEQVQSALLTVRIVPALAPSELVVGGDITELPDAAPVYAETLADRSRVEGAGAR